MRPKSPKATFDPSPAPQSHRSRPSLPEILAASLLLLVLLAGGLASAEPATDAAPSADRADLRSALVEHLERTRGLLDRQTEGLSEAQWNFKPAEDQWSIAEVTEHLAVVEDLVYGRVSAALAEETPAEILGQAGGKADQLLAVVLDRSQKFQAPERVQPAQRWESTAAMLAEFERLRRDNLALARQAALWSHATEHPVVGPLDVHGWLLFVSGHCERHIAQIAEIKTADGYPEG